MDGMGKMDRRVKSLYYIMLKDRVVLGPRAPYVVDMYIECVKEEPDLYPFKGTGRVLFGKLALERLLKN